MKNSHINLCLDFLDINLKRDICKELANKKLYGVYRHNFEYNFFRKRILPHKENKFPFSLIGKLVVYNEGDPVMTQTAIVVDESYILTAGNGVFDYLVNKGLRKTDNVKFIYAGKEYVLKNIVNNFEQNFSLLEQLLAKDLSPEEIESVDYIYESLAFKFFKGFYQLIEISPKIDFALKEDLTKVLTGFAGLNHAHLKEGLLYRIKMISYVDQNDLHPIDVQDLIEGKDMTAFKDNSNLFTEFCSLMKYRKSDDFLTFNIQGIHQNFLGSPIFVELHNGEIAFFGIFTGTIKNETLPKCIINSSLRRRLLKRPVIAEIFPDLVGLKENNVVPKDILQELSIKQITNFYSELTKKTYCNTAWQSLKTEGSMILGSSLRYMPNLSSFDLRMCVAGPIGTIHLSSNFFYFGSNLKYLNLSGNKIGPKAIGCIAFSFQFLANLNILDLNTNLLGDEGAHSLAIYVKHLKMLSYFDFMSNKMTEAGVKQIMDNLPESSCYMEVMSIQ